ncbi:MAG: AAA family ATPase [Acidimicrobiia bacterium]
MPFTTPPLVPRLAAMRQDPLVGREVELAVFEDVWAAVEASRRRVVFIGGEPGAGKTRLAAEVSGVVHDMGVTVLVGTSTPEAGVPFQPFAEMLDQLVAAAEPGALAPFLAESGPELGLLSPAVLRHLDPEVHASPGVAEVRRDLFDAVARLFTDLSAERPLVLVFDDLHWAHRPTLALLDHVIRETITSPVLVIGTFRTTDPDRSDELAERISELHRLEGIRRLDVGGLDTEAIAEYLSTHTGVSLSAARAPAAMLRDRTGGNPFFLREMWLDLERRGGIAALRSHTPVPASIGDTIERRLAGLGDHVRPIVEMAAVIGDTFDVRTLADAVGTETSQVLTALDAAEAVGLVEPVGEEAGNYSFVHALTRETVIVRLASSRLAALHAQAGRALEAHAGDPSFVPRLAHHFLASHVLGNHALARRYASEAGMLSERSLAFEEAAVWFERAAALPEIETEDRSELLFAAAANHLRAGDFARARAIYERLSAMGDPMVRLRAAVGYEDANWRPGLANTKPADLLVSALGDSGLADTDADYIRGLGSLGRALAFAGETDRAREVGSRAIGLAERLGDLEVISHTLKTSLWYGLGPDMAAAQLARATHLSILARDLGDSDTLASAAYFRAMAAYLMGDRAALAAAAADGMTSAERNGQPFFGYVAGCVSQGRALLQGEFEASLQWAESTLRLGATFGPDTTEGSHGVQMFMIHRETGGLDRFRDLIDGSETFSGRWVPGLLALYTELGVEPGIRRALDHLFHRDLARHVHDAQWPMELVFMTEAALAVHDHHALGVLRPYLARYTGLNLVSGQFIAPFGSADRYLGRVAAALGETEDAERHFTSAVEMDRRMGAIVHEAEGLAHHALFLRQRDGVRAKQLAAAAHDLARPIGQVRVLRLLEGLGSEDRADGLTDRELEVLRLLAAGLSNKEIAGQLYISANTAANHVRSILMKTGTANRTQAAIYAQRLT